MKKVIFLFCSLAVAVPVYAAEGVDGAEGGLTGRMMMLALQLGIIIFATRIGKWGFQAVKLPGVLGELVSGILVGPFAFGGLRLPWLPHGVFPLAAPLSPIAPELHAFGAIAAIILLFDAGLETDLQLLMRYSVAGVLVGVGGIVVTFVTGAWITSVMSPLILGMPLSFTHPICLFMAVVSTATSVGITARVLSEKRKLDSPEGVTIISAAIVDDVLGIVLLAIVLGIASASMGDDSVHWGHVTRIGAKALGVWLLASAPGILAS